MTVVCPTSGPNARPHATTSTFPSSTPPTTALSWGNCERFDIPDVEDLGTARWECTTLSAPIDPFGDTDEASSVELALTRHRATGDRRGAILINPGGPRR